MNKPRPRSDSMATVFEPEFGAWCSAGIYLWLRDPHLHFEFPSIVHFVDWMFETAETLIISAETPNGEIGGVDDNAKSC